VKISLLIDDPGGVRSGRLCIDPLAPEGDALRVRGDLADLSPFADDGEVECLEALDVLGAFPLARVPAVLQHWCGKLAIGGTITVSTLDPYEVGRALAGGVLRDTDATSLLYGSQTDWWKSRKSCLGLPDLSAALEARGLKVVRRLARDYFALVTARRP
jgi:hypothetical protein